MKDRRGFSLFELLVAILILAVLAALLFPVFGRAKEGARKTETSAKLKQVAAAVAMYRSENDDILPPSLKRLHLPPDMTRCSRSGLGFYYPFNSGMLAKTGTIADAPEFNESQDSLAKAMYWHDFNCGPDNSRCENRTHTVDGRTYTYAIPATKEAQSGPLRYKVLGVRMDGSVGMFPQTEEWENRHISGGEGKDK